MINVHILIREGVGREQGSMGVWAWHFGGLGCLGLVYDLVGGLRGFWAEGEL